ncbi:Uncharacterized protein dnm_077050 [Desulfonema magnum]|uniref:Uncharacterized protein n=1 Tax=Desulfonema magnum TaxID=45655 RepID=A0A975GT11_9BACT|nr:Uncharacterized protein dnm_064970 [Desulfonema magnum]QTA90621.1 Uncharacterized protein dnm_066820 [Desulfonema magnum]QTA91633.1 Uncharacterized protein dnm_077050 [Desulfonema magnum]
MILRLFLITVRIVRKKYAEYGAQIGHSFLLSDSYKNILTKGNIYDIFRLKKEEVNDESFF